MASLSIAMLGELRVVRDGVELDLPASRKTRALLAYLALTGRPHRRDRLCEVFWDGPGDPRGALRWSLSKLRQVVDDDVKRIVADRERAALATDAVAIDINAIAAQLESATLTTAQLRELVAALAEPLLDGVDLPDQELFQRWLNGERQQVQRLAARGYGLLAQRPDVGPPEALDYARRWLELEPYAPAAASVLLAALKRAKRDAEAQRVEGELALRFRNAGLKWPPAPAQPPVEPAETPPPDERQLLARQSIRFCTTPRGVRLAYASVGQGAPVIKAANWLSHLELDWDAPIWSPLFRELARDHLFIRYDERGNGLSDWQVGEISFDAFVSDLEAVVDALGIERFALLGISQGASVSIEYAVRYPERVTHLVLFGAYAAGWRIDATADEVREREAIITLTESGWGRDNPAYRQIFSSTFMPSATAEELNWFNEFQRRTTSPANAARFLSAFGDIDVRERLA
ncbi:MAG: alpha/beta fold hydrolase, partial [Pseudomonadota bacterium]